MYFNSVFLLHRYTQINLFRIFSIQQESDCICYISDWFGTKRNSVYFRKMVNIIQIWSWSTRLRISFSVCIWFGPEYFFYEALIMLSHKSHMSIYIYLIFPICSIIYLTYNEKNVQFFSTTLIEELYCWIYCLINLYISIQSILR